MSQAILQNILFAIFPLCVAYGAASDIMTMTIPNWLVAAMVAGFVLLASVAGMDVQTFGQHWLVAIVVLVIAFACFAFGWVGGGDAKFAAAIVLWLGPSMALEFVVASGIWGAVLTLALLSFRARLLPALALKQEWLMRLHDPKAGVPYGFALAAAALVVYPQTGWLTLAVG